MQTKSLTEILKNELDRSYGTMNSHYGVLLQILVATVALISGVFAIFNFRINELTKILISYFVPLPLIALMAGAIVLLSQIFLLMFHIRSVSERLRKINKIKYPISYYDKDAFSSIYQSSHRGNVILSLNRIVVVLIPTFLLIGIIVYIFTLLYEIGHYLGTIFIVIYGVLLIGVILGLNTVIFEIQTHYEKFIEDNQLKEKKLDLKSIFVNSSLLRYFLPRPNDFITKAIWVVAGMIIAWYEGFSYYNPQIISALFAPLTLTKSTSVLIYSFLWLFIQEGIIQQAKYIWNDIRDFNSDKSNPVNTHRPITKNKRLPNSIYFELIFRWIFGLFLSIVLSIKLFYISFTFLVLQMLYELWAKPNSTGKPLTPMIIVALGAAFRFLGGTLAMGWNIRDVKLFYYLFFVFFIGVVYSVVFWKLEGNYLQSVGGLFKRGQTEYFLRYGNYWVFSSVLIIITLPLVYLNYEYLVSLDLKFYNNFIDQYINLPIYILLITVIVSIAVLVVDLMIKIVLYFPVILNNNLLINFDGFIKRTTLYLSILSGIYYLLRAVFIQDNNNALCLFVFVLMLFVVLLYFTDYKAFTLTYIRENFMDFIGLYFAYFFMGDSKIKFRQILVAPFFVNTPKFKSLKNDLHQKIH